MRRAGTTRRRENGLAANRARSTAEQPGRQQQNCAQQLEDALERNADEAKGQLQQPGDRPQDERQQSQRPAQHKEQEPEQQLHHWALPSEDLG